MSRHRFPRYLQWRRPSFARGAVLALSGSLVAACMAQVEEDFFDVSGINLNRGPVTSTPLPRLRSESLTSVTRPAQSGKDMTEAEMAQAIETIDRLLVENPDNLRARSAKGVLLVKLKAYPEAIDVLEHIVAQAPNDVASLNNLAWIYATADDKALRNGPRAVELGKRALIIAPENYHIWSTLSAGHYITGEFLQAFNAGREAMRIGILKEADPENLEQYRSQIFKSAQAQQVFSLLN